MELLTEVAIRLAIRHPDEVEAISDHIKNFRLKHPVKPKGRNDMPAMELIDGDVTYVLRNNVKYENGTRIPYIEFYKIKGMEKLPVKKFYEDCCFACTVADAWAYAYFHYRVLQSIAASSGVPTKSPWTTNG